MKRKQYALSGLVLLLVLFFCGALSAHPPDFDKKFILDFLATNPNPAIIIFGMLIPLAAISGTTVFAVLFVKWWHQRRMMMIEKGQIEHSLDKYRLNSLLWGILALAAGGGITVQALIVQRPPAGGIVLLFIGAGLLIFRRLLSGTGR